MPDTTTALHSPERRAPAGPRRIARGDSDYPVSLYDLSDPPRELWAIGCAELARAAPVVAVVGTRSSTPYGEKMTRELVCALARAGACVVSGMARGIDAAAHRAALEEGGRTVAVLGTGVDVPYPVGHRTLHELIGRRGLVLSESGPGTRAFRGCFPRRNRIIAALATVTIVVEAGVQSGALNTAMQAHDLGRTIGAVPGPIDTLQAQGTNGLIRDNGAVMISDVADAIALVGLTPPVRVPRSVDGPDAAAVWSALADGPLDSDALCSKSALPAHRCLAAVTELELMGAIECGLTGLIQRR